VVLIAILGFLAVWSYVNLDQRVFSLLCQKPVKWDRNFWVNAFTYLGKAPVLIWLTLIWFLSTGRHRPLVIVLLALLIVAFAVDPLKVCVRRERPYAIIKAHSTPEKLPHWDDYLSFPSGDTAVAFAGATAIISFVTWPWACLLLAASAGIALLRVTAMAHYPSDVLAGAALGCFAGWVAIQIEQRWLALRPRCAGPLAPAFWRGYPGHWPGLNPLPPQGLRFNLSRCTAILAATVAAVLFGLFEGFDDLLNFLAVYGLSAMFIFALANACVLSELVNSERFVCVLNWLRKRRILVMKLAFAIMVAENIIGGEKPHELNPFDEPSGIAIIGLMFVVAGAFIRLVARGHLVKGRLSTTGPYAMIRHPLYLGSLLVVVGILFQLNDWINWIVVLTIFTIFHGAAIIYEERSLEKKFGPRWHLYKAEVPAIIPSLRNWSFPMWTRGWSWRTYRLSSELWGTLSLLSLPWVIELVVEDFLFERMLGV